MSRRRAIVMLTVSFVGVLAILPVFVLATKAVYGDVPATVGNFIMLLDIVGPVLGLAGGIAALRGSRLHIPLGLAGGGLGLAAAALILVGTYPWDTYIAIRNLLLLHVWAAFLVAAAVWPRSAVHASGAASQ